MASLAGLSDRIILHRIQVERYGANTIKKIGKVLDDSKADLEKQLRRANLSEKSITALRKTLAGVKEVRDATFDSLEAVTKGDLIDLSKYEAEFNGKLYASVLDVPVSNFETVGAVKLRQLVTQDFLAGRQLKEWVAKLNADEADKIKVQLRLGIIAGESDAQMVDRIIGNGKQKGVVDRTERWAQTMVRTAVADVSQGAHMAYLDENQDLFPQAMYIAVLDERTCETCAAYGGEVFELDAFPDIPLHPNCRCVIVGIPEGTDPDEFAGDFSYDEWLGRQPEDIALEALGQGRYDLWKDGMSVRSFIDTSGKALTLDELRESDDYMLRAIEGGDIAPEEPENEYARIPDPPQSAIEDVEDYLRSRGDGPEMEERLLDDRVAQSEINSVLKSELEDRSVWMRAHPDTFENILEDGRFKSQFETGTSGGLLNNDFRAEHENKVFGYDPTMPDDKRPIYGYATADADGHDVRPGYTGTGGSYDTVDQYGNIAIELKPDVRDRTTFTFGDSLAVEHPPVPQGAEDVTWHSIRPEAIPMAVNTIHRGDELDIPELLHNHFGLPYIEAQVHGGVSLKDIEGVTFYHEDDMNRFADKLYDLKVPYRMEGADGYLTPWTDEPELPLEPKK